MKLYIKLISIAMAMILLCGSALACSDNNKNDETVEPPEITAPKDTYIISLYTLMAGGLSFYDYDDDGRLLSISPVDPYTMQMTDANQGMSIVYTYSEDGKLTSLNYLSYEMNLSFGEDGRATEANYSDNQGDIKIIFEYGTHGRISKETVYNNDELFMECEYNDIGMLSKETMSLVGEAAYRYMEGYDKIEYSLSYSDSMVYTISSNDDGRPYSMTLKNGKDTQTLTWEYSDNGLCSSYTEKTTNSETRYEHKYNADNKRIETKSYYNATNGPSYMIETMEFEYGADGGLTKEKYSFFNDDGTIWSVKRNEYDKGLCTVAVEEEYDRGTLSAKSVVNTVYNEKGLVTSSENAVYKADGSVKSRFIDDVEYDSEDRLSKLSRKNYGDGDVYDGMTVEEYEYSEDGGYKQTTSIYDADGALLDKSEDIISPED